MERNLYRLLLKSIQGANILPVTSACNSRCLFCSHLQNPPGIEVYSLPRLRADELLDLAGFLQPGKKIVIGESVTRIMEGEPFLHPELLIILTGLRRHFPETTIQITTNGMTLTPEIVAELAYLGGIELIVSLNSVTAEGRRMLMGDNEPQNVLRGIAAMQEKGIPFTGSIVAMPHLAGWEDLHKTIDYLMASGATTIRVFMPGYTHYTRPEWIPPTNLEGELQQLVAAARAGSRVPLFLEPPGLTDLTPEIIGVIDGSPAWKAGLVAGDIINTVAGEPVFSRADAFQRTLAAKEPVLTCERGKTQFSVTLAKRAEQSPGFVLEYDLEPGAFSWFQERLQRLVSSWAVVTTSRLGAPVLEAALAGMSSVLPPVKLVVAENRVFGGNIGSAGLLLVEDIIAALQPIISSRNLPDRVFVPGLAFDYWGRDLRGCSYLELQAALGVPVEIVA
jgi:pyruvate-formate lyase-activating enzyme